MSERIDLALDAAVCDLNAYEARFIDAAEDALLWRAMAQEAVAFLHQAREHSLRQGRTIASLRDQVRTLMGIADPIEDYYQDEGNPWR
jgi:hypothetical protein